MANKQDWLNYFELLQKIAKTLGELTELEADKAKAVTKGDLPKVDDIMKREQAFAMTLRGHEQKRIKLLGVLAIPPGPISQLHNYLPKEVELQGKRVIENVRNKYGQYRVASDMARDILEANLKQMESLTGQSSGYVPPSGKKERDFGRPNPLPPSTVPRNLPPNLEQLAQMEREGESALVKEDGNKSVTFASSRLGLERKVGSHGVVASRATPEKQTSQKTTSKLSKFVRKKKHNSSSSESDISSGADTVEQVNQRSVLVETAKASQLGVSRTALSQAAELDTGRKSNTSNQSAYLKQAQKNEKKGTSTGSLNISQKALKNNQ